MQRSIDKDLATQLLQQLLTVSPYASDIKEIVPTISHLANENTILNKALNAIIAQTNFKPSEKLDTRSIDKQDLAVIENFFEYLYFTSEAFLGTAKTDPHQQEFDVCIIGTGAGGGIIAHRLAMAGMNVISVEQGNELSSSYFSETNPPGIAKWYGIRNKTTFPPTPEDALFIHDLFAQADTRSSSQASESFFRQFQIYALNGLQNLWNGVSVRFSEQDLSSWPIAYTDLAPHYSAVEQRISVCGTEENIADLPDGCYIPPKPIRPVDRIIIKAVNKLKQSHAIPNRKAIETRPNKNNHCISTGICTFGCPVGAMYKFSARLLPQIRHLPNYTLLLGAKVVSLEVDPENNHITHLNYLDTQTRKTNCIRAKRFVLAAGAIESPRILFNSKNKRFPRGLANSNGTLGQYLQDNPKVVLSTSLVKLWYSKTPKDIGYGDLLIILSKAKLKNGEDFSFIGHSISAPPDVPYYLASYQKIPRILRKSIAKALFNSYVTFGLFCEGDLLAENCVQPSNACDKFGIPQIDINYRSSDITQEKMQLMAKFGRKVLRNATAIKITEDHTNDGTGIHYAGTCRMGEDPKQAIVDKNLKTFDHDNLFICDGGVIPHLPDKHLTLTIMALSDRLANHLIQLQGKRDD